MTKLDDLLNSINKLEEFLKQFHPAANETHDQYWQGRLELSQLYEQAGDCLREENQFFRAVEMYFRGTQFVDTETLVDKLNFYGSDTISSQQPITIDPNPDAHQLFLKGLQHQSGIGVPKNMIAAVQYYQLAESMNELNAQTMLGIFHNHGLCCLKKDLNIAFDLFTRAAQRGNANAQYRLSIIYHDQKNENQKYIWLEQSSLQGNHRAQNLFAGCKGHNNTEQEKWAKRSALQGNKSSQQNLAYIYASGEKYAEAIFWCRKVGEPLNNLLDSIYRNSNHPYPKTVDEAIACRRDFYRGVSGAIASLDDAHIFASGGVGDSYAKIVYQFAIIQGGINFGRLPRLFQKNPHDITYLIVSDDLLTDEQRQGLVTGLHNDNRSFEEIVFAIGMNYFDQLAKQAPWYTTKKDIAQKAVTLLEHVPIDHKHYTEAADAIVVMLRYFNDTELDELNHRFFTSRGKKSMSEQMVGELQKKLHEKVIKQLQEYVAQFCVDANRHTKEVAELLSQKFIGVQLTEKLNQMEIQEEDPLFALRAQANKSWPIEKIQATNSNR